ENIYIHPSFKKAGGKSFRAYITNEGNYQYDAIGNLIVDNAEGTKISWTPYGKVREVRAKGDSVIVAYRYDASGNRVEKRTTQLKDDGTTTQQVVNYVRDASGNVMAIYEQSPLASGAVVKLTEQPIYGSSRLGQYKGWRKAGQRRLGRKMYELSNHLGNVLAVITDNINMTTADGVTATVVSTTDYYPFGLEMKGRTASNDQYRYGFNGKEKDGSFGDVVYDYGFRIYSARLSKFLTPDPLSASYAYFSPYQFAGNKPIMFIDLDGAEPQIPTFEKIKYGDNPVLNAGIVVNNTATNVVNGGIGLVNSGISLIHKIFTDPTAMPSEIKSESQALISETGKYFKGQYNYITQTPIKQQLVDIGEGLKNPESYEAPLEFATALVLTKNFKINT
ncbi:MAG: RHS repeat domain-containing protein, partial [Flammeovirgaceae bacterium]